MIASWSAHALARNATRFRRVESDKANASAGNVDFAAIEHLRCAGSN
jgi:hypothetical protein